MTLTEDGKTRLPCNILFTITFSIFSTVISTTGDKIVYWVIGEREESIKREEMINQPMDRSINRDRER